MPEMIHPDLPGVVIDVDVHKARNRRKSGWVDLADGGTVDGGPYFVGGEGPEQFPDSTDPDDTVEDDG